MCLAGVTAKRLMENCLGLQNVHAELVQPQEGRLLGLCIPRWWSA